MVFGDMENADGCLSEEKQQRELIHWRRHWKSCK